MAINPYQRRSDKKLRIEPLFPRYLFLNAIADQQSLGPVRSTRGVSTLVRFGLELARLPETVMNAINNRCDPETGLVQLDPVPVEPVPESPRQEESRHDGPGSQIGPYKLVQQIGARLREPETYQATLRTFLEQNPPPT